MAPIHETWPTPGTEGEPTPDGRLRILDPHWAHGTLARQLRPRSVLRRPCGALAARRAVRTAAAAFDELSRQAAIVTRPLIIRRSRLVTAIATAGHVAPD